MLGTSATGGATPSRRCFVTQRGLLLGVPLALIVWTLWWKAHDEGKRSKGKRQKERVGAGGGVKAKARKRREGAPVRLPRGGGGDRRRRQTSQRRPRSTFAFCLLPFAFRQMLAAGVVAGLLPLVHAHSFVVMMWMGGVPRVAAGRGAWASRRGGGAASVRQAKRGAGCARPWVVFFAAALVAGGAADVLGDARSGGEGREFFGWEFGWDHGAGERRLVLDEEHGALHPAARRGARVARARACGAARLLFFYLPFVLCFVVPNVYKLSPWVWDNIKVLFYWWVASAPLVALLLARLWRRGGAWRAAAVGVARRR